MPLLFMPPPYYIKNRIVNQSNDDTDHQYNENSEFDNSENVINSIERNSNFVPPSKLSFSMLDMRSFFSKL